MRRLLALLLLTIALPLAAAPFAPYKGGPLPPFTLPDLDDRPWSLEAARGRVVVVNFWATWCPPCVAEMPSLERLQKAFAGEPLEVVAVNVGEEPFDVALFLRRVPVEVTVLLDRKGSTQKGWKVRGLPTTVIVDADGKVRYHVAGQRAWDSPEIEAALRALLPSGGRSTPGLLRTANDG
jgi:thiol-disulfide isomerase/thioredoxin